MNKPLVSVVIPVYNVEKYLDRCIQSVVSQSYKDLEIILVDDGSPDACPAMCDSWAEKDARIKAVHKKNAGLGMARNTGMENANGKYICFFDSDDYVDLQLVEKCVASAEEYNSDVVAFGLHDVYDDGRETSKRVHADKTIFKGSEIVEEFLPGLFTYKIGIGISSCGKMYNLCTLNKHGQRFMSEREIVSEDAYFALEYYSKLDTVTVVNEDLYFYWKRTDSLTHSYRSDRCEKNNSFLLKSLELIKSKEMPKKLESYVAARYHFYMISAMKQVVQSDMSKKEKKKELCRVFKDDVLLGTLTSDVFEHESRSLELFWKFLKIRCYFVCRVMLAYKIRS